MSNFFLHAVLRPLGCCVRRQQPPPPLPRYASTPVHCRNSEPPAKICLLGASSKPPQSATLGLHPIAHTLCGLLLISRPAEGVRVNCPEHITLQLAQDCVNSKLHVYFALEFVLSFFCHPDLERHSNSHKASINFYSVPVVNK